MRYEVWYMYVHTYTVENGNTMHVFRSYVALHQVEKQSARCMTLYVHVMCYNSIQVQTELL